MFREPGVFTDIASEPLAVDNVVSDDRCNMFDFVTDDALLPNDESTLPGGNTLPLPDNTVPGGMTGPDVYKLDDDNTLPENSEL
jgi:hypothetical protein